ncbi:ACHB-like protein [Mya arenaria]|uniref:ACHB-like protein n=1 Tax=Mya arenaria TaxID=6604 RepID=A0ABY7FNV4_MYAAR|nr:ACHB-like protein [Mya arenaria]
MKQMKCPQLFLFVVSFCFLGVRFTWAQSSADVVALKTQLFTTNSYNTKVRPVTDSDTTTTVTLDYALVGINSFNDADQKLTTTGFLTIKWTDEMLTWTPADYNNIQSLLIPQNDVWQPDVHITHEGAVTWSPYEVFDTSCTVQIVHFPFDRQICDIRFITWMTHQTEVNLNLGTQGFYTSNFEKNGKWDVESMTSYTETSGGKSVVGFRLTLNRRSSFYVLFLILPAILLSILNAFVFVLPAGSGEKVGYSLAVFLSYALFYTILSESLPKNSDEVSTVAAYLFFMMFLSTFATIITIVELRVYNKTTRGRLPMGVLKFVRCILHQKCMCCEKTEDFQEDYLEGDWTRVIGPWLACDWKDFIDALDFVLFWVFLIGTIFVTALTLICASSHVTLI